MLGMALAPIIFIALSLYLFHKTSYAEIIYGLLSVALLLGLGEKTRADQLKYLFNKGTYYKIRLFENLLLALPFMIYLIFENSYLTCAILCLLAILLAIIDSKRTINYTLPTPFKKFPFEFIVGTRKNVLLILIAHFVLFKAIQVQNFNLSIAAQALLLLTSMSYYFNPEKVYFTWIYSCDSKTFLRKKVLVAITCSSILLLPAMAAMTVFFPDRFFIIIGIQVVGYIYLSMIILAKYSAFPQEMSIPQAILIGLSIMFPPMLLLVIPIFYKQAIKKVNLILT